jgi:hypothetical protein
MLRWTSLERLCVSLMVHSIRGPLFRLVGEGGAEFTDSACAALTRYTVT